MATSTSFVGRDAIADRVRALLDLHALVTLTGPGGMGKTRLATEVASTLIHDGHVGEFVTLTDAKPGGDLSMVFARQVGHESIEGYEVSLDGRRALVVLDNCEHVVEQVGALVDRLVAIEGVQVLATSRERLGVAGEHVVALGPLRTEADPADEPPPAVELFLERAAAAGASWLQAPAQRDAVAEVVRRLDGIPLAIELAAARTRAISPTDLLELLPRQLDLLDAPAGRSDAPRGVRDAVRASYEPLDEAGRAAFRALSIAPHAFDLDFATSLLGVEDELVTLDRLTGLIDRSLLATVQTDDGATEYRLLEPIRAFGLEQLDAELERGLVASRYVDVVVEFADRILVATASSFSSELLDEIARRYGQLLTATEMTLELDATPARAYRLLLPLYAPTRAPRREQARLAARVRERWPDSDDRFRSAAYAVMAHIALWAGNEDPAPHAREALADPGGTRIARIIAQRVLAFDAARRGDRVEAIGFVESALEASGSGGGSFQRELRMTWASLVDDPAEVPAAIETAEEMARSAAERVEAVPVVWASGVLVHQQIRAGLVDDARPAADRALAFAERSASPWPTASAHRTVGHVLAADGEWDEALRHFRAALESAVGVGDVEGVTLTIRSAAICAQHCGVTDVAEGLWTALPTRYQPTSLPPAFPVAERELGDRLGVPIPLPLADSVRVARDVLAPRTDRPRDAIRFGECELDMQRRELRRNGDTVHLEPQVFDVLVRLAEDAGSLVTREQLLDDVWGSRFVSPSAVSSRIKTARAAVGDDGSAQKVIRTVHGRGFIFVADVT